MPKKIAIAPRMFNRRAYSAMEMSYNGMGAIWSHSRQEIIGSTGPVVAINHFGTVQSALRISRQWIAVSRVGNSSRA